MLVFREMHSEMRPTWDLQEDLQIEESGRVKRTYKVNIKPGMSHYYISDDYYSPTNHVLSGSSGALYLPTSCGKYSYPSKYSVDTPASRYSANTTSMGAKHSHQSTAHRYEKPRSRTTDKFASIGLSPAMGHRPNISTERLLEQNTPLVPLGTSRATSGASSRQVDPNRSPGTPRRSPRNIKAESESNGTHNKITFDLTPGAPELLQKPPSLRRSKKYKGETEKQATSPGVSRQRKKQVVTFNMFEEEMVPAENGVWSEDDDSGDEMKEGVSSSDAARWIGCGEISSPCVLTADRGYLIWNRPKGALEVIFRYGETGEDFSCFVDPQFKGVKVLRDRQNGKYEEIIDGLENPKASRNRHHRHSACRNRPENNFEFNSKNGLVRFMLEALEANARSKIPVFKINYTLIL